MFVRFEYQQLNTVDSSASDACSAVVKVHVWEMHTQTQSKDCSREETLFLYHRFLCFDRISCKKYTPEVPPETFELLYMLYVTDGALLSA